MSRDSKQIDYLSPENLKKLMHGGSKEEKSTIANQIVKSYGAGLLSKEQKKVAEQVFETLLGDSNIQTRHMLAHSLQELKVVPREILLHLAKDVDEVSFPILQYSEAISDDDLMAIVSKKVQNKELIKIVSKRKKIGPLTARLLIGVVEAETLELLIKNKNCNITDQCFYDLIDARTEDKDFMVSLMLRPNLSLNVLEYIMQVVSDAIYEELSFKYAVILKRISRLSSFDKYNKQLFSHKFHGVLDKERDKILLKREIIALKTLGFEADEEDVQNVVEKSEMTGVISPIYALCSGNLRYLEMCMARLTGLSVAKTRQVLDDKSNKGFRTLFIKAGLPLSLFDASSLIMLELREVHEGIKGEEKVKQNIITAKLLKGMEIRAKGDKTVKNLFMLLAIMRKISGTEDIKDKIFG